MSPGGINGSALLGLNMSSPRCINVQGRSIGDEELLSIAYHLIEICLSGFDGVTDTILIALGKNCHQQMLRDAEIKQMKDLEAVIF